MPKINWVGTRLFDGAVKMIVTKTPLRVSFLGGGSDYPEFFKDNTGFTLGAPISLYVYTTALKHSALADAKFKLTYRENESVNNYVEFKHPLVREVLRYFDWKEGGLHISTLADVPARTGLGSSSSFAVGLINAISNLKGDAIESVSMANAAIDIERNILGEAGGWQDQIYASLGGISLIKYESDNWFADSKRINESFYDVLNHSLMLVNVGGPRNSADRAAITQRYATAPTKQEYFRDLADLAKSTHGSLCANKSDSEKITILAKAVNEAWEYKSRISDVSSEEVKDTINWGLKNGAIAAKLCGAGGSGFVLFIIDESARANFKNHFTLNRIQEINIVSEGTEVVYFDDALNRG